MSKPNPNYYTNICIACHGSGEIYLRRDRNGVIDFRDGETTGEIDTCKMCNGEGIMDDE